MKSNTNYFQFFISLTMALFPFVLSAIVFILLNSLSTTKDSCMKIYDHTSYIQRSLVTINDESQFLSGVLVNDREFGNLILTSSRRLDRNQMQQNMYEITIDNIDSINPLYGDYISNKNIGFFQFSTSAYVSALPVNDIKPAIGEIAYTATLLNGEIETYSGRYSNSITLDNGNLIHIYSGSVDIQYEGSPVIDQCGRLLGVIIEGNDRYFAISSLSENIFTNSFE